MFVYLPSFKKLNVNTFEIQYILGFCEHAFGLFLPLVFVVHRIKFTNPIILIAKLPASVSQQTVRIDNVIVWIF